MDASVGLGLAGTRRWRGRRNVATPAAPAADLSARRHAHTHTLTHTIPTQGWRLRLRLAAPRCLSWMAFGLVRHAPKSNLFSAGAVACPRDARRSSLHLGLHHPNSPRSISTAYPVSDAAYRDAHTASPGLPRDCSAPHVQCDRSPSARSPPSLARRRWIKSERAFAMPLEATFCLGQYYPHCPHSTRTTPAACPRARPFTHHVSTTARLSSGVRLARCQRGHCQHPGRRKSALSAVRNSHGPAPPLPNTKARRARQKRPRR
jgi:hypothetical protein